MKLILKTIFQIIIEIIFPRFCVNCGKKDTLLCLSCHQQLVFNSFPFKNLNEMKYVDDVIIICKYNQIAKRIIYEYKYKSVIAIKKIIAKLIYRAIKIKNYHALIPVPMHKNKRLVRGFNQSEEISLELSKLINIPTLNMLKKIKETNNQMSTNNYHQRTINLKDSFKINKKNGKITKVFLIDDVITTGSTLNECAKILKQNGIKTVTAVAFAS